MKKMFTCWNPQPLKNRVCGAAIDDHGDDYDEEGRAEDHLPALGDGVPDRQSKSNCTS